jgi:hypothetical protein
VSTCTATFEETRMGEVIGGGHDAAAEAGLEDRERDILDFEREWWKFAGAKEEAIRERFDLSSTRYYQLLNELIDSDRALAYDPMLVKRLRRMRAARRRQRAARRRRVEQGR